MPEAQRALSEEVSLRIRDELTRVVAERNLRPEDRQKAVFLTTQWRVRQITDSGGSVAVAREKALADDGTTLEKLGDDTYGKFVGLLFTQTILLPRAEPSADEVRDYFRRHRDDFGSQGKLRFLLVEVDASREPEKARLKADRVRGAGGGGGGGRGLRDAGQELQRQPVLPPQRREAGESRPAAQGRGGLAGAGGGAVANARRRRHAGRAGARRQGASRRQARGRRRSQSPATSPKAQTAITQLIRGRRLQEMQGGYSDDIRRYAAVTPPAQIEKAMRVAMEVVSQEYDALRAGK